MTEALPMDGLLRFKRRASGPLSAVVSFGGSLVYVALPEDYGAAYVRIPDEITLGDGVAKVGELPFEVHTSQRVVSVDRVYSDDRLVAEEFGLSDGITRRAYARPPEQLLDQAVWTSSIRSPVLHVPDYLQSILREVGVAPNEDASESLQGGQIVSVARPAGAARMQLEIEPGQDFRKMVRMRIDPAAGSPESYSPPRRVRIQVLRPDGTESRIVFQNWPLQDIRVLLPPVGLSPGDRVRLEFS